MNDLQYHFVGACNIKRLSMILLSKGALNGGCWIGCWWRHNARAPAMNEGATRLEWILGWLYDAGGRSFDWCLFGPLSSIDFLFIRHTPGDVSVTFGMTVAPRVQTVAIIGDHPEEVGGKMADRLGLLYVISKYSYCADMLIIHSAILWTITPSLFV